MRNKTARAVLLMFICSAAGPSTVAQGGPGRALPPLAEGSEPAARASDTDAPADAAGLPAGHSGHGEVFNEGPRQKAYLMGGTGKVDFPVTTANADAREFFNQGVGQLHGFWYFEAERSFRQAAALDPDCAMAYWGMAMANIENEKRAKGFIEKALEKKAAGNATRREEMWMDGLATYLKSDAERKKRRRRYMRDLEDLIHEFPGDIEAKAFLACRIWQFRNDCPISSHEAVNALLEQVFAVEPMHPAHHYKIHLWDREKGSRAIPDAALCGLSAPSIAHMWHMPGHIYSGLKRYADAAWQQEASARVDHAHMIRDRILPDQIHNYAHNNEWLIRNLIHVGRGRDALDLARNMLELPRHPIHNTLKKSGRSASYGRARLLDVLMKFEMWNELVALSRTAYLEETDIPAERLKRLRALGIAYHSTRLPDKLAAVLAELAAWRATEQAEREAAQEKAETEIVGELAAADATGDGEEPPAAEGSDHPERTGQMKKKIDKARSDAARPFDRRIERIEATERELRAYESLLAGYPAVALEEFKDVTGADKLQRARFHLEAADVGKAEELARQAVDAGENEVLPLANHAYILERCGKLEDAKAVFERLRKLSAHVDLALPPFRRLSGLARRLNLGEDWRVAPVAADDIVRRTDLDALGPFRWRPYTAPDWSLADSDGQTISLRQYRGQPVVVIFYLGFGCLHCVEQLNIFAPKSPAFRDAGIALVAISTDKPDGLKLSQEKYAEEGAFPFPLLSDSGLEVFRAFRAYDDFEAVPLHGTFLIDGDGLVRWQDISYEPFDEPDFLLEEARRLLDSSNARLSFF